MSKVMVVEDDVSLREIYSIRITAEGYEVVSAGDGEEALAMAVREKPDLILSDVMMPKISGFDMLDILRSTPETAGIKVVMMTALSGDDQRKRGESLGADRYLVKSQVGIEDVVNTIHEVLGDKPVAAPAGNSAPASEPTPAPAPTQVETRAATPTPVETEEAPISVPPSPVSTPEAPAPAPESNPTPVPSPEPTPAPVASMPEAPAPIPTSTQGLGTPALEEATIPAPQQENYGTTSPTAPAQ
jgi:CheY-like chemotaxis protein